jgi:hypothetical protein
MSANWSSSAAAALPQEMSGSWQFAGGVADFQMVRFTFAALWRVVVGLLIATTIVVVLTNPSGAQTRTASNDTAAPQHNHRLFTQCMQDWDRATHMTKAEWAGACQRILREPGHSAHGSDSSRAANDASTIDEERSN